MLTYAKRWMDRYKGIQNLSTPSIFSGGRPPSKRGSIFKRPPDFLATDQRRSKMIAKKGQADPFFRIHFLSIRGTLGCEFVRATGNRATEQQRFCRLPVRCSAAMTLFQTKSKKTNHRSAVLAKISPIDIYVRYLISTYDI